MPKSSLSRIERPATDRGETSEGFCVVCGRANLPLEDGVCADCFAARHRLISAPQRAVVVVCPTCGARRVGRHWAGTGLPQLLSAQDLTPLLQPLPEVGIRRVDWEEVGGSATVREYLGRATISFRDSIRTTEVPLSVRVDARTCPDCSRKSGHFFTAVLQLRAEDEGPRERAPELRRRLEGAIDQVLLEAREEWRRSISWRVQRPEGWDYFFTDTLAARSIARLLKRRLDAGLKESASLFGRKEGRDVYRVTFCVRVPRDRARDRRTPGTD